MFALQFIISYFQYPNMPKVSKENTIFRGVLRTQSNIQDEIFRENR